MAKATALNVATIAQKYSERPALFIAGQPLSQRTEGTGTMSSKTVADKRGEGWQAIKACLDALKDHPILPRDIERAAAVYQDSCLNVKDLVPPWLDAITWLYLRYDKVWAAMPSLSQEFVRDALHGGMKSGGDWRAVVRGFHATYNSVRRDTHKPLKAVMSEVVLYDRNSKRMLLESPIYSEYMNLKREPASYVEYQALKEPMGDDTHVVIMLHMYADPTREEVLEQAGQAFTHAQKSELFKRPPGTKNPGQPHKWRAQVALYSAYHRSQAAGYTFEQFAAKIQSGEIAVFGISPKAAPKTRDLRKSYNAAKKRLCPRDESPFGTFEEYRQAREQETMKWLAL